VSYDNKGNSDCALVSYNAAIALRPDYVKAYYQRGLVYAQQGKRTEARQDLVKVLELSTDPLLRQQVQQKLKSLDSP
jgi:tetratricopeptide (TPR) repeat protein